MNDIKEYEKLGVRINTNVFKRYFNAGLLKLNNNEEFVKGIQEYWEKHYNKKIDPILHLAFMNLTGKEDPRVVPGMVMWKEMIPFFNDLTITGGYKDKNIYDILIKTPRSVENVLKCVRGNFFDALNNGLHTKDAYQKLIEHDTLIIKPSNRNNGVGISKIVIKEDKIILEDKVVTIDELKKIYANHFLVQKVIQQHPVMAAPHPASVNTLRMVTLRWKNEIKYLLTFARFGANNDVKDNAGSGGVCLGVTDSGGFLTIAVDEKANTYTHHPTTNFCFEDMGEIPNFEEFKQFVISSHKDILHHDFVSWDIAVGSDGYPVFIEANFAGATWLYQLAAQKPIFGDLTEEVLEYVKKEKNNRITQSPKQRRKRLQKKVNTYKVSLSSLKDENTKLKQQLDTKEKELNKVRAQYSGLLNSKSFKVTRPLRRILKIFK